MSQRSHSATNDVKPAATGPARRRPISTLALISLLTLALLIALFLTALTSAIQQVTAP